MFAISNVLWGRAYAKRLVFHFVNLLTPVALVVKLLGMAYQGNPKNLPIAWTKVDGRAGFQLR